MTEMYRPGDRVFYNGSNYEALSNNLSPPKPEGGTYWKLICTHPPNAFDPSKPLNPTVPVSEVVPVPGYCDTIGYPSSDRTKRMYTTKECAQLGGQIYATTGDCLKNPVADQPLVEENISQYANLSVECRGLNAMGARPTEAPPAACRKIGVSSADRNLRMYTQYECEEELGGYWEKDKDNEKLGVCMKSGAKGSWSTDCRGLNWENIGLDDIRSLPSVPGEVITVNPAAEKDYRACITRQLKSGFGADAKEFGAIDTPAKFQRAIETAIDK
jgi:hypothetical protein